MKKFLAMILALVMVLSMAACSKQPAKDPNKELYLELLLAMNELFRMARRDGLISVEGHVNKPQESAVFKKW